MQTSHRPVLGAHFFFVKSKLFAELLGEVLILPSDPVEGCYYKRGRWEALQTGSGVIRGHGQSHLFQCPCRS
jgi:hypothetical protein